MWFELDKLVGEKSFFMSCFFYEPHKQFYSQIKYCILLALTVHIQYSFRLEVDGNKTSCDAIYTYTGAGHIIRISSKS